MKTGLGLLGLMTVVVLIALLGLVVPGVTHASPPAHTASRILVTNVTMHAGTVWTQTFATVYAEVPTIAATYSEDPGGTTGIYFTATVSNCLYTVKASKNFNVIVIGR